MKQTTEEVIKRVTDELLELTDRLISLERFLVSKDYQKVSIRQKVLLVQQRTAMEQYKEILLKRLVDLRNQEEREKYMDMPRAPAEEAPRPEDESGTPAN